MKNKIRFYDRNLIISGISLIIIILSLFLFEFKIISEDLFTWIIIIPILCFIIPLAIFSWGMIYNKYKNKRYFWLFIDLLLFLIFSVGIHISCIIFYFKFMRKEFKKE